MIYKRLFIAIFLILLVLFYIVWENFYSHTSSVPQAKVGYKEFVSHNQKLKFSYLEDWKCNEIIEDVRIDCYPLTRLAEEYDAGLEQKTIYYPDISFHNEQGFCDSKIDESSLDDQSLVYNEAGDNYYGLFYKRFNGCLVRIITLPYIDTAEKLIAIIK